jgi:hypothetical protein
MRIISGQRKDQLLCHRKARTSTELARKPTILSLLEVGVQAMKKFVLAAIAVLSLGIGSAAFAHPVVYHNGVELWGPGSAYGSGD